jgi:phenylalanyl-tRNA synthetase alpha chain
MQAQIDQYTTEINAFSPANADELEIFRIKFLGTKGIIKDLFEQFKTVGPEEKRVFGKVLNQFKQLAEAKYNDLKENLNSEIEHPKSEIDLTLPGDGFNVGSRHPLSLVRLEIIDIFKRLGFVVAEGPEIEDDWHNFSALNFPKSTRHVTCRTRSSSKRITEKMILRFAYAHLIGAGADDGKWQATVQGHHAGQGLP